MKYTFMDLLLKKVIEIKEISKKPHPKDKYTRTYTYVVSGKNFRKYRPKNHESIFLSPFNKEQDFEILFNNFIKMVYDASKGSWNFKKLNKSNLEVTTFFKSSVLLSLFKLYKLTDKGILVRTDIDNYLNGIDKSIDNLLHNDKKKGIELLLNIGGNIFLLKNLDFQLLKKIDKEILNQHRVLNTDTYDSTSNSWLYMDFYEDDYMFDSYFDSFDDTLDSFDTEFDASGCYSGCYSGGSSCGGCGGCH
ncbi:MAG: hypothetical protein QNK89_07745 [Lacinutrix sp.]|uniref:hypothetical protein n=1 Tax=Lacinutrix sp. TaxID=1937692 RepID=UPI00309E35D3